MKEGAKGALSPAASHRTPCPYDSPPREDMLQLYLVCAPRTPAQDSYLLPF
jgi:hypothetical protein